MQATSEQKVRRLTQLLVAWYNSHDDAFAVLRRMAESKPPISQRRLNYFVVTSSRQHSTCATAPDGELVPIYTEYRNKLSRYGKVSSPSVPPPAH